MNVSNWSRENIAWAAAVIDSEGYIRVGRQVPRNWPVYRIRIKMADKDIVERLSLILLGENKKIYERLPTVDGRKVQYELSIDKRDDVYAILIACYQWFSKRRKAQVRDAMQFYRTRKEVDH